MPKKKKSPDPLAGMRELRDREAEQREQDGQTVARVAAEESDRAAWDQGWKKLESAIAAYLAGQSSRAMVDEICELNNLVDAVGLGGDLQRLRHADAFPKLDSLDDAFHLAIFRMVAVVWIGIRFDAADPDELVKTLDANEDRKPIQDVAFVRHFIEKGGLRSCPQCGKPQAPTDILRDRCESCRRKDRTSLIALQRAIECEHRHGQGEVYTGGVETHYPSWSRWKIRLTDYVGADDASDHDLWRSWVNYVRRKHGLDQEAFLRVPMDQAENLLPPQGILLAREQDNRSRTKSHDSGVIASTTTFRPEDCDDDLWFQLDVCIREMESVAGAAYVVIRQWKIGTESDAKYLQNINGLAIKAGWKPFVFPSDEGLEVVRTNGEKAFCHNHRDGYWSDEIGGEAVLSALRAWREKRSRELKGMQREREATRDPEVSKTTKKLAKPNKVTDIPAKKLVPYLSAGRLHLAWIEANKPSRDRLQWFLDENEIFDMNAWDVLRNTARRTANRYGFNVSQTAKWVKSLEIEIERRRSAGILVPGSESWD